MNQPTTTSLRLESIDTYRGFVMFLMMAEVLHFAGLALAFPENVIWRFLALHQSHLPWSGATLHDLIQPSFSMLVGVALPFSLGNRLSQGQSKRQRLLHAASRALILILLGIFLRSMGKPQTYFTFEDTLTQIGLGYFFLYLLGERSNRTQWLALGGILLGYWLLFVFYPIPTHLISPDETGVPVDWPHNFQGFASHWNKNANPAWLFDRWFLNIFPREKYFVYNDGGYATLSFIPTLGTMILGLIAGNWIKHTGDFKELNKKFIIGAAALLFVGYVLDLTGICPSVKRIWTPAWVLVSGGWCFLILLGLHWVIDQKKWKTWAWPLIVIGTNSIAAYCISWTLHEWVDKNLRTHLGQDTFKLWGIQYESILSGAAVLLVFWLILRWMYKKRIFIKI